MRAALAAVAAAVAVGVPGAAASFPGRNGLIAFASERGGGSAIYTMHTDGTGLRRLTVAGAPDAKEPAFSRDGRLVAFTRAGDVGSQLWVGRADGTTSHPVIRRTFVDVDSLHPAWTPDGRIAYSDGEHGLRAVGVDGRGDRLLLPRVIEAAWSPDGRRLAFVRANAVWVGDASGARARRVGRGDSPTWSPDSKRLAFAEYRCDTCLQLLRVADAAGGAPHTILRAKDVNAPAWSPDGRRIAFSSCCVDTPDGDSATAIQLVSPSGTGRRTIAKRPDNVDHLAWTRDGRRLVWDDQDRLWSTDARTGATRLYFRSGSPSFGPVWSPDGRRIYFYRRGGGMQVMNADGSHVRSVHYSLGIETMAPDETRFAATNDADGIDVVSVATGKFEGYQPLVDDGAGDTSKCCPAWSPRSNVIAYIDGLPVDAELKTFDLDTGKVRDLHQGSDGDLTWAPDGRRLAFGRAHALYVYDVPTRRARLLTRNASEPTWSPDGNRIAFVRMLGENSEIYTMRADGAQQHRITQNPGADIEPSWQSLP